MVSAAYADFSTDPSELLPASTAVPARDSGVVRAGMGSGSFISRWMAAGGAVTPMGTSAMLPDLDASAMAVDPAPDEVAETAPAPVFEIMAPMPSETVSLAVVSALRSDRFRTHRRRA